MQRLGRVHHIRIQRLVLTRERKRTRQKSTHTEDLFDGINRLGEHAYTVKAVCKRNYAPPAFLECLSRSYIT